MLSLWCVITRGIKQLQTLRTPEPLLMAASWEEKFNELQSQHISLKKEFEILKTNKNVTSTSNTTQHSAEFWSKIRRLIVSDPDAIHPLIKNKTITPNDCDETGRPIINTATIWGRYNLIQFLINQGADFQCKDRWDNQTPLDMARTIGRYDIEQLLMFADLNLSIGNEIKQTSAVYNGGAIIFFNLVLEHHQPWAGFRNKVAPQVQRAVTKIRYGIN